MNTRDGGCSLGLGLSLGFAVKAFLTLLLLLTMPFFIKLISNRSDCDPSLHCETSEHETDVRNPDEPAEYHQGAAGGGYDSTTCSQQSYLLGRRQKVIAFTYFKPRAVAGGGLNSRKYVEGILGNLEAIVLIYGPEWTMRLYHNLGENDIEELLPFTAREKQFVLCDINRNPLLGNASILLPTLWRFLPLLDDQVEVALFRDLDSRPSRREMEAVEEWMLSKHVVHVMRDHPGHDMPILAGMWGVKLEDSRGHGGRQGDVRSAFRAVFLALLRRKSTYYDDQIAVGSQDQALLERYVWPWAKSLALQHDSYHCDLFAKSHPWPSRRPEEEANNFVGSPVALNSTLDEPCPKKCRPREHPEWRFC